LGIIENDGMKFELEPHNRNVSNEDLLADADRVAKQFGKRTLTIEEYNELGRFHSTTLTRRFGSWFSVLEKIGLAKTRNLNISNEDLFHNLVEVWTTLGHQPRYRDLTSEVSKYCPGTYEDRFGGWRKALEAFASWANESMAPSTASKKRSSIRRTPRNINWRLRALVLLRDGAKCRLCGATPADGIRLHVDHVKPWNKGGETVLEDLQILCHICNVGKSDIELDQQNPA
jgi:5-methylcytosine-specific restriction endonuclease McrA